MQKLVTVSLYSKYGVETHSVVEVHLEEYLNNGWQVVSMTPAGMAVPGFSEQALGHSNTIKEYRFHCYAPYTAGWIVVLLEKA